MFGEPIARINGLLRVVFITGGASGIGAACAVRFLRGGWRVSLLDLNDVPGPVSENVLAIHGDVTVEATRQTAVQRTLDRLGRIDAVIHSAGIGLYRTCLHTEPDHLKQIFETNFVAPWRLSQLVLPVIRKSGSGTIVNIGSVAGEVSLPWAAAYSASKSATHSMMESMRRELAGTDVRILDVRPGIVATNFRDRVLGGAPPKRVASLRFAVTPQTVADRVYRAVERGKSGSLYVPRIGRLFGLFGAITPGLMDWYLSTFGEGLQEDHSAKRNADA